MLPRKLMLAGASWRAAKTAALGVGLLLLSGQVGGPAATDLPSAGADGIEPPPATDVPAATEAPTGFDNLTNGFLDQGPDFGTLNNQNIVPLRSFNDNRFVFEQVEGIADGLGPTYNAQSCRECHQNVVTGGASQITELRTGHVIGGVFFPSNAGSIVQARAISAEIVEFVPPEDNVRTFRLSTNTLGNGFVECIADATLLAIRDGQPSLMRGTAVMVPVLEASNALRVGRFGWKCQHASLQSFAADAYLNEMGITSPLQPTENPANGVIVAYPSPFDPVPDPEDDGVDVQAFADFMRSTKAPSRGPVSADALAGERLFTQIGCSICHRPSITTAMAGAVINGGTFTVPDALGSKIIHPYSDFLLHNIGTGDGIAQVSAETANQMRTAPLWGLRTRNRLMHDGLTLTPEEAIQRHAGQALIARFRFATLGPVQKSQLLAFLGSL